jgi:hypothetical protein
VGRGLHVSTSVHHLLVVVDRRDNLEEIAWAAGFIDAEGCFSFSLGGRFACLRVRQTQREPLDRLACALGIGNVRGPFTVRSPSRPSVKDQFDFCLYGTRALQGAYKVWPFLAKTKRGQLIRMRQRVDELNPRVSALMKPLPVRAQMTRRQELAWAAGFFDGDGCFGYTPRTGICVAIGQRDRDVLDRFLRIAGVGKVYGPYERTSGGLGGERLFQYRAQGFEKTQAIAALLWFKLDAAKRAQAIDVLRKRRKFCQRGHPLGVTKRGCPRCVAEAWARKRRTSV